MSCNFSNGGIVVGCPLLVLSGKTVGVTARSSQTSQSPLQIYRHYQENWPVPETHL